MSADWHDSIPVVIGAVGGGAAAFLGSYFLRLQELKLQKENIASAFLGEIEALQTIVKKRRYFDGIRHAIAEMERTHEKFDYAFIVRAEYFNVFKENVGKIGLLDSPLPELIVTFYTQAQAILEDFTSILEGRVAHFSFDMYLYMMKEILELAESNKALAERIVSEIKVKYPNIN